jgi:hypothetical protein
MGRIVGSTMDEVGIKIERSYQGDGEWERILFSASIGDCHDDTSLDCGEGNFKEIGNALRVFPKKRPDEYSCTLESEYGSGDFKLHAYADKLGHTNLEIVIERADNNERRFLIPAEPAAIQRLGELFLKFSKPKYRLGIWSLNPDSVTLLEWELPKLEHPKIDPALAEWEHLKKKHPTHEEIERGKIARKIIEEREGPKQRWELPG